jgi:hypothetical protein
MISKKKSKQPIFNMKTFTLLFVGMLMFSPSYAQGSNSTAKTPVEQDLQSQINNLNSEKETLKTEILALKTSIGDINININNLKTATESNSTAISSTANQLGIQITTSGDSTNKRIDSVDSELSKNSLYGIIGVLLAILLSGILYWLLSKRQKIDKSDFIEKLSNTKASIEESLVKEFGKQTELMDLQLVEQQKNNIKSPSSSEPDHSLALKVASEINLIERNINLMDSKTKGLKQLQASVGKLKDNLSANGYQMPELLGKPFNTGLKVLVSSSIPDENLEKGQEIISKILIPAVMYNDKMIQTAQIEVSVGY